MTGYDELSTLMGSYPELAMFRRFGPLSAKVLLCMQAELLDLEDDLNIISEIDFKDWERREILTSWVKANAATSENGANLRRRKVTEAQEKLERYYAFVLQLTKVLNLSNPERRDFESLREWLASEEGGNHFLAEAGVEAKAWDADSFGDLMALKCQNDRFAQWIINAVIPTYHRRIGYWFHNKIQKGNLGDLWHYKHEPFTVLGNVVCTLLSSLLPSCCIFALYYVKAMLARLVLITCFSFAFSFVMTFIIQARRQDVFATTTALAAVQVVFVGGVNVIDISGNKT